MPKFIIEKEEIETILQLSIQQGGSKHRQEDIYKALDRVIARGPMPDKDFAEKIPAKNIDCPYCGHTTHFVKGQLSVMCNGCGKGYFRSI